jgi:hypothetical protein
MNQPTNDFPWINNLPSISIVATATANLGLSSPHPKDFPQANTGTPYGTRPARPTR